MFDKLKLKSFFQFIVHLNEYNKSELDKFTNIINLAEGSYIIDGFKKFNSFERYQPCLMIIFKEISKPDQELIKLIRIFNWESDIVLITISNSNKSIAKVFL